MDRLLQMNEAEWGLSRAEYARRHVAHMRADMKKRRQRQLLARLERGLEPVAPDPIRVTLYNGHRVYQVQRWDGKITLPWVSIMAGC